MALHRYKKTNGGQVVEQRKGFFGWRTLRYLDSDLRKQEEIMNQLIQKFEGAARKRLEINDMIEEKINEIENSGLEEVGSGRPFVVATGGGGWVKSFFTDALYAEQKPRWIKFYNMLKDEGLLKSVTKKMTFKAKPMTAAVTEHTLQQLSNNQQKKQNNQQNNNQK